MRTLAVPLEEVLSLASCAEDYGFGDDVLLAALGEFAGHVTDEEIAEYAARFTTPEMRARGYSEEDAEGAARRLTEWRDRYAAGPRGEGPSE